MKLLNSRGASLKFISFILIFLLSVFLAPTDLFAQKTKKQISKSEVSEPISVKSEKKSKYVCCVYWWMPYQYFHTEYDERKIVGLDVALLNEVFARMSKQIIYEPAEMDEMFQLMVKGECDLGTGAYETVQRKKLFWFSDALHNETGALFMRRDDKAKLQFETPEEMLAQIKSQKLRMGVVASHAMPRVGSNENDDLLNSFVDEYKNSELIVITEDSRKNLVNLINNKIDLVIADPLTVWTLSDQFDWGNKLVRHRGLSTNQPIHVIFNKKTVSPEFVKDFNVTFEKIVSDGTYEKIMRYYMYPVLIGNTVNTWWFSLIDIIGIMSFAFSGLVIARREHYSIFGAFVLAGLPALGGGAMRDLLVGRFPLGFMREPIYVLIVFAMVVIGWIAIRLFQYAFKPRIRERLAEKFSPIISSIVDITDTLGMASFTVVAVLVAIEQRCEPMWIWGPFLALVTSCGGGIVRDVIRNTSNIGSLKWFLYAEVSFIWGLALSIYLHYFPIDSVDPQWVMLGVLVTMVGAPVTRFLMLWLNIKSPKF